MMRLLLLAMVIMIAMMKLAVLVNYHAITGNKECRYIALA